MIFCSLNIKELKCGCHQNKQASSSQTPQIVLQICIQVFLIVTLEFL